jgi:hypothetical protein
VASEVLRAQPSQRPPRLLKALRCVRSLSAALGVEPGEAPPSSPSSTTASPPRRVYTTSRLHSHSQRCPHVIGQRLEGAAVDVLTSRTWCCTLKPEGSLTTQVILPKGHPQVIN